MKEDLPITHGHFSERVLARSWGEKQRHHVYAFARYEVISASRRWVMDDGNTLWFEPVEWAELPQPDDGKDGG